jgi:hypothetical protein
MIIASSAYAVFHFVVWLIYRVRSNGKPSKPDTDSSLLVRNKRLVLSANVLNGYHLIVYIVTNLGDRILVNDIVYKFSLLAEYVDD